MTLEEVQDEASYLAHRLKLLFKPGVKVLFIVKPPNDPDGGQDFVLGDLPLEDAANVINRSVERVNGQLSGRVIAGTELDHM